MKKMYLFVLAFASMIPNVVADNSTSNDTTKLKEISEVSVKAVQIPKNAPFAITKLSKKELQQFERTGEELPYLFARTPGVVAWSENGMGVGLTYLRIRGSEGSRINVTLDGVSLNSPEDQCVFWQNMNSYASFLDGIQIQRGVGTSTNGDGAFGGTISLNTSSPSFKPTLELTMNSGSYNTWHVGGKFSTGLLFNHLVIDGAYNHTASDGYIHGTTSNSGSYYAGATYLGKKLKISYKNIGNYERVGYAWNGIDTGELLDWNYGGMGTGIFGYKDMYNAGLGRYNSLYEYLNDSYDPSAGTSRYTLKDGSLWKRTTDDFKQNHNLLNFSAKLSNSWSTSATIHYTRGHGYYLDFKPNCKLSKFGISNYTLSDGTTLKKTDFIRKKGLTQNVAGLVWNTNYKNEKWNVILGLSTQHFWGDHYGYLTYVGNDELESVILASNNKYPYYDSDAQKTDMSTFVKATYNITDTWSLFGDLQYRFVNFKTTGYNDKFYALPDGTYANQILNVDKKYNFVNPKFGLSYHQDGHKAYISYALSHREPERNNYTDNGAYPAPHPEMLNDIEVGYGFQNTRWNASIGGYYMLYHNQFVRTGEVSDIGESLTTNIKKSYRLGIEVTGGVNITDWFSLEANAAISQNKIKNFNEIVDDWDNGSTTIHYNNSTLAFSPTAIVNGFADFHIKGFSANWHTGFVSKQYLDNTACNQRSLPKYTRTDIALTYNLNIAQQKGIKHVVFGVNLNNIFNAHYASSGWVYSAIYASGGNPNESRYTEIGYLAQAGFTGMLSITLKF